MWVLTPMEFTSVSDAIGDSDWEKVGVADGFAVAACEGVGVCVGTAEGRTL
jgi:hypothetical protein